MKHCVVLVHIGDIFYEYLNLCINQIKRFNDCDIYLIISEKHFEKITETVTLVDIESIKKSKEHLRFIETTQLDLNFRAGFWRSASERFFYLNDVVKQFELENVFHFENDMMIYCNLENILKACIVNNFKMASTFDNDKRCIPGFVYFKDRDVILKLNTFMLMHKNKNDMELIALFKDNSDIVDFFPVVPDDYRFGFLSILKTKQRKSYSKYFKSFDSIFDAAAIGQYLGGIDSRNTEHATTIGFVNENALYKVTDFKFDWDIDEMGRRIPIAEFNDKRIKINNLHIHSKNLIDFQ